MFDRGVKGLVRTGGAVGLFLIVGTQAHAGAFALREQSAYGQGLSFAGMAAGGALSSMYWNAATMTQYSGLAFESNITGVFPHASHSYTTSTIAGTGLAALGYGNSVENSGNSELVPSFYASYQFAPQLWLGIAVNAPFGLSVNFPTAWAGSVYGQDASLKTYNFNPSLAFKINDMFSVSAGLQVQYMDVQYAATVPGASTSTAYIGGKGISYGYTLGLTITPTPTTTIGIGYRSAIDQDINGALSANAAIAATTLGSINLSLPLPDLFSVGIRQRLGKDWTVMGQFEMQNWGRIGTPVLYTGSGSQATIAGTAVKFPFQYSNSWFASVGAEYYWRPDTTLRAGIGFEKSPITDGVRTPRLPDNDRMWYSVGASYKPPQFKGLTFDLGYSFIQVKDTPIDITASSGNPWYSPGVGSYVGSVDSHIHIISFGARYAFAPEQAPKPHLITK